MAKKGILGSEVRDIYTGFKGIAIARTEWLYGCARVSVEPTELKDGKPIEPQWFDEQRIELVQEKAPLVASENPPKVGGPQNDPRRSDPAR